MEKRTLFVQLEVETEIAAKAFSRALKKMPIFLKGVSDLKQVQVGVVDATKRRKKVKA